MTSAPDKQLEDSLRSRGMRVTPQRVLIHRALRELDRHVSADEVLAAVSERLPNASLPTVYATLDLLEELGMVRRLSARSGAALYDPRVDPHEHGVCRSCGRVEDLDVEVDAGQALRAARRAGFEPAGAELVISGLCGDCAKAPRTGARAPAARGR
jgi:Fe2+ or Zn2+ uptake regulation protein